MLSTGNPSRHPGNRNNADTPKDPNVLKAELLLLVVVCIWAIHYPIAKYALSGMNIFVFNSMRYIVATIVAWILFAARSRWVPVTDWKPVIIAGIVASVIYQITFIIGLNLTTAGNAAVLLATSPLWTIFFHAKIHREHISVPVWLGMLFSLSGVVLIIIGSGKKMELGGNELTGDLVSLAAAALWGLNSNLQKPLLVRHSAMQLTLIMVSIGAVGLTLAAVPVFPSISWQTIPWMIYGAAVLSGAFSIGIANMFWSYGIQRLGPGRTANFYNLVPILAFILAFVILKEVVLMIQVVGAIITVLGVGIVRKLQARQVAGGK